MIVIRKRLRQENGDQKHQQSPLQLFVFFFFFSQGRTPVKSVPLLVLITALSIIIIAFYVTMRQVRQWHRAHGL